METKPKQLKKKICMLGTFGVGKTSLVHQFVHSIYDDTYLSTIGVKIDRKEVDVDGTSVVMLLWDIAGEEEFFQIPSSYIAGAAGGFLVIDGTRPETLEMAIEVKERLDGEFNQVPMIVLLNKTDLTDEWSLTEAQIDSIRDRGWPVLRTSAKSGENVENAFLELAKLII